MNTIKTYYQCEFCNQSILTTSPPSNERYERGEICIKDGTILLPDRFVELNSHSRDISGYYCSPKCLKNMIKSILPDIAND